MSETVTLSGPAPVEVVLKRHARARRMSLRISRIDGKVTLTLPPTTARRQAERFLESQRDWVLGHLRQQAPNQIIEIGAYCPVEGQRLLVAAGRGRAVNITEQHIEVPTAKLPHTGRVVEAALKLRARDRLAAASDHYATHLGRSYSRLTLRDTRSRWGSCSSAGALMYSWRLILAPPEVLNYVAAHEVAHLQEMNHSAAFWRVVKSLMPEFEEPRAWLRREGDGLHRWIFK